MGKVYFSSLLLMFSAMLILLVLGSWMHGLLCVPVCECVCVRLTCSSFFHSAYHSCDNNFFSWAVHNHSINHKHYFTERPHEHNCSWIPGRKQRHKTTSSSFYNQNSSCNKYFSPAREILRSIRSQRDMVASDTQGNDGWAAMSQGDKRYLLWYIIDTFKI